MDREAILRRVVLLCRDFIRDISYHRAMLPYVDNLRTNIWIYTFNNFIDMAVLNWCHLFGSHNDELHWRNVVADTDGFKDNLLTALTINNEDWEKYWNTIKDYRDKDVAHIEVRPESTVPELDMAISSVCLYYSVVLEELRTFGNEDYQALPDDLSDFNSEVTQLANDYVNEHVVQLFEYAE